MFISASISSKNFEIDRIKHEITQGNVLTVIGYFGEDGNSMVPESIVINSQDYSFTDINDDIEFTVDSLTYKVIDENHASVIGYTFDKPNFNVPESVAFGGKAYIVSEIGNSAFENSDVQNISLPDSITKIGDRSFFNTDQLTEINLPSQLETIGYQAFYHGKLSELILPTNLKHIGAIAFSNNRLTSIIIPDSVISIGAEAFAHNMLELAELGNSLSEIGLEAFYGNYLENVISNNRDPIDISSLFIFDYIRTEGIYLKVPEGTKQIYSDMGWTPENNIIDITEDITLSTQSYNSDKKASIIVTQNKLSILDSDQKLKFIKVYDMQGKELITSTVSEVFLDKLNKGIYLAKIRLNDQIFSKKIIKF